MLRTMTSALLTVGPIAVAVVALLNALDASQPVAIGASTIVVIAGVLVGLAFAERYGELTPHR
jgi:hypothetical protein